MATQLNIIEWPQVQFLHLENGREGASSFRLVVALLALALLLIGILYFTFQKPSDEKDKLQY